MEQRSHFADLNSLSFCGRTNAFFFIFIMSTHSLTSVSDTPLTWSHIYTHLSLSESIAMHLYKYDYGLQIVDQYLAFDVFISANNQIKRHLANTQSIVAIIRHPRCA